MYIVLSILAVFILIRQISTLVMMWKANGSQVYPHFILLVLTLLLASCTVDDEEVMFSSPCVDDSCIASMNFPGYLDSNGYYHIDLDFTQEYPPRFTIDLEASMVKDYFLYNGDPVVTANFNSDTSYQLETTLFTETINVVPNEPIYFSKKSPTTVVSKRIVGPFPPEIEGDTIQIEGIVWWEAGMHTKGREINAKFIVE